MGFPIEYSGRASLADLILRVLRETRLATGISKRHRARGERIHYPRLVEELVADYEEVCRAVGP